MKPTSLAIAVAAVLWGAGPGAARPDLLREAPAKAAQAAVRRLPNEIQSELFTLYARYQDLVANRSEEGWRGGLLTSEIIETPRDYQPARQIEQSMRRSSAEIADLEKRLARAEPGPAARLRRSLEEAKLSLDLQRRAYSREKGTCLDWSDAVWAEIFAARPRHWTVVDRERQARPFHAAAVLCPLAGPQASCLVLDPWERGRADVYEQRSWDEGSFSGIIAADFFLHELPEPKR